MVARSVPATVCSSRHHGAGQPRRLLETEPGQQRGHEVDVLHGRVDHGRRGPRQTVYHQRHVDQGVSNAELVAHQSALAEVLAVVGGDDHDPLVLGKHLVQLPEDARELGVRGADVAVVEPAQDGQPVIGRRGATHVPGDALRNARGVPGRDPVGQVGVLGADLVGRVRVDHVHEQEVGAFSGAAPRAIPPPRPRRSAFDWGRGRTSRSPGPY